MKTPSQSCIIDTDRQEVKFNGKVVYLAPKERAILSVIGKAKGHVVSRTQMLERAWGYDLKDVKIDTRTVDQHVARLRTKLRKLGATDIITTVPLHGYRSDSISFFKDETKERIGKVTTIERVYGKKAGSIVTMFVPDLLPDVEAGRTFNLS